MAKKYDFKYMVIGSGPAGTAVALALAKAKKNVCIVEGNSFGGSNINRYDIPCGVALDFAHNFFQISQYPELKNQELTFNFPTVTVRELDAIAKVSSDNQKIFENTKIIRLKGYAHFLNKHTVAIGDRKFTSENFILATGSRPKTTDINNIENINFLTPKNAFRVHRLPQVITIIGGGPTGCEIAEYFAELGVRVLLLEAKDRILPNEDPDVSETISEYFNKKLGIAILTSCKVVSAEQDEYSKYLVFRYHDSEKSVRTNNIILATGSEPNLDCGLENASVKYRKTGITVNRLFQTSTKNIYAIGDCISSSASTDRAQLEGSALAKNLISRNKTPADYSGLTRITNTMPKVAVVGLTETELKKRKRNYKKAIVQLSELPASKIHNFEHGFIKILINRNGQILGACVVAPHAELLINEISLAIRHKLTILELASTPHVTNSYNDAIRLAAKKLLSKPKTNPKPKKH